MVRGRHATASDCTTPYRRRRPEHTLLYRTVQTHFETWLALARDGHDDEWSVPEHVEREFRRYLDCGILAHGFARARCGQCGHDFLIAFSCKGRGVCPSCAAKQIPLRDNTRRMVATAAHLTDHVFPCLPLRQWGRPYIVSILRTLWRDLKRWCGRPEVRCLCHMLAWGRRALFAAQVVSWLL